MELGLRSTNTNADTLAAAVAENNKLSFVYEYLGQIFIFHIEYLHISYEDI